MSNPYGARAADHDRPVRQEIQGVIETKPTSREGRKTTIFASGSVLGALAMSSCCILPLVLFSLGITGAWIGGLTSMYPYKWIFFAATSGFLGGGFYFVYRKPSATECDTGSYCATPIYIRINKIVLWSSTVLVLAAASFTYVSPIFLDP